MIALVDIVVCLPVDLKEDWIFLVSVAGVRRSCYMQRRIITPPPLLRGRQLPRCSRLVPGRSLAISSAACLSVQMLNFSLCEYSSLLPSARSILKLSTMASSNTRPAAKAGSWYTANAKKLSAELDANLDDVPDTVQQSPLPIPGARVVISPQVFRPILGCVFTDRSGSPGMLGIDTLGHVRLGHTKPWT